MVGCKEAGRVGASGTEDCSPQASLPPLAERLPISPAHTFAAWLLQRSARHRLYSHPLPSSPPCPCPYCCHLLAAASAPSVRRCRSPAGAPRTTPSLPSPSPTASSTPASSRPAAPPPTSPASAAIALASSGACSGTGSGSPGLGGRLSAGATAAAAYAAAALVQKAGRRAMEGSASFNRAGSHFLPAYWYCDLFHAAVCVCTL